MVINVSDIKQADILVDATKDLNILWINVEFLKAYLRKNGKSLNMIQVLHEYLVHLQKERFVFDCSETYLALSENTLFAFAKGKYSFTYRLDVIKYNGEALKWEKTKTPSNMLLRLRNAINIMSTDTDEEMCSNLIATISSDILV